MERNLVSPSGAPQHRAFPKERSAQADSNKVIVIEDDEDRDGPLFRRPSSCVNEDKHPSPSKEDSEVIMIKDDEDSDDSLFGSPSSSDDEDEHPSPSNSTTSKKEGSWTQLKGLDTPAAMECTLMRHQRIGLEWLLTHEQGPLRGSVLADDMGLGKTIQALALILANPPSDPARCKTTLIVAPLAVLQQWRREIDQKTKPGHKLSVHIFHDKGRKITIKELMRHDVVITNYDTLQAEFKRTENVKTGMVLLHPDTHFHRVILDEAHNIKNRKTLTARGAFRLKADYRLAMTGTPLQNKTEELFATIKFLRIPLYKEWKHFKSLIVDAPYLVRTTQSIHKLRDMTMLVRKKTDTIDGKPIISLPKRTQKLLFCVFSEDEKAMYTALEEETMEEIRRHMRASATGHIDFSFILAKLLRLRQACCHPTLITTTRRKQVDADDLLDLDEETLAAIQASDDAQSPSASVVAPKEPAAKSNKSGSAAEKKAYHAELEEDYKPSAKILKTLKILESVRQKAPQDKVIVFSFFVSYLDILAIGLQRAGFSFKRYDGSMNPAAKDAVIGDFTNPTSGTQILLTSLKSGNAGLNLSIANHVIIEEPFWNPSVEDQAVDRAYRIGQVKPVCVYRLLVQGTVEDRIVEMQMKKRSIVDDALGYGDGRHKLDGGLTKDSALDLLKRQPDGVAAGPSPGSSSSTSSSQAGHSRKGSSSSRASLSQAGPSKAARPSTTTQTNGVSKGPSRGSLSTTNSSQAGPSRTGGSHSRTSLSQAGPSKAARPSTTTQPNGVSTGPSRSSLSSTNLPKTGPSRTGGSISRTSLSQAGPSKAARPSTTPQPKMPTQRLPPMGSIKRAPAESRAAGPSYTPPQDRASRPWLPLPVSKKRAAEDPAAGSTMPPQKKRLPNSNHPSIVPPRRAAADESARLAARRPGSATTSLPSPRPTPPVSSSYSQNLAPGGRRPGTGVGAARGPTDWKRLVTKNGDQFQRRW